MLKPLNLKEAIALIESGQWISLRVITADLKKRTGGKIVELAKCRHSRKAVISASTAVSSTVPGQKRSPNHHSNMTRNVELQNGSIIKVHPPLVTHINNVAVL